METNKIVRQDAFEFLKGLPDDSVDCIVTAPPYESLRKWEGIGTTARMGLGQKGSGSDDPEKFFPTIPNSRILELLDEFYRALKTERHVYVMCDGDTLPTMFDAVGYGKAMRKWKNLKLLIWDRINLGRGYHYRSRHEYIVMLDKGKNRRLNDLSVPDVLAFKKDGNEVPTQKPVALFSVLIRQSTRPGELVLDPFMGAGTAAVAAKACGRNFVGSDIDQEHVDIGNRRALEAVGPDQEATSKFPTSRILPTYRKKQDGSFQKEDQVEWT